MKQLIKLVSFSLVVVSLSLTSCKKEDLPKPESATKKALIAHTWKIEQVSMSFFGTSKVIYQRGAANNEEDFSQARTTFKANGSAVYVDVLGNTLTDGWFELMDNDKKIKLGSNSSTESAIFENLEVTSSRLSYTFPGEGISTRFVFSPQ